MTALSRGSCGDGVLTLGELAQHVQKDLRVRQTLVFERVYTFFADAQEPRFRAAPGEGDDALVDVEALDLLGVDALRLAAELELHEVATHVDAARAAQAEPNGAVLVLFLLRARKVVDRPDRLRRHGEPVG